MENHENGGKTARAWHLSYFGKKEGPYSIEEARKVVARKGKFNAFCWTTGMESWSSVETHPEFLHSDSANEPERRVSWLLAAGIFIAPYVFVWWLLRKGHTQFARIIGFSWIVLFLIVANTNGDSNVDDEPGKFTTPHSENFYREIPLFIAHPDEDSLGVSGIDANFFVTIHASNYIRQGQHCIYEESSVIISLACKRVVNFRYAFSLESPEKYIGYDRHTRGNEYEVWVNNKPFHKCKKSFSKTTHRHGKYAPMSEVVLDCRS